MVFKGVATFIRCYRVGDTSKKHISVLSLQHVMRPAQGTSNSRFTTLFFANSRFTTLFFREFTFTPLYLDFTIHDTFLVNSRFTIKEIATSRFTTIKNPIHDSRPKISQIHDSCYPLGGGSYMLRVMFWEFRKWEVLSQKQHGNERIRSGLILCYFLNSPGLPVQYLEARETGFSF